MQFELIDEFRLSDAVRKQVGALLQECFPEAAFSETRIYTKQLPPRRLLATENGELLGHLALEHRVVGTKSGPAEIFGVRDVCVPAAQRGRGIASRMLAWIESLARERDIPFLMLFADDPRLYQRNGFRHADNRLRWAKMHEHEIIGIGEEVIRELMIKPLTARPWPEGLVDLLGPTF